MAAGGLRQPLDAGLSVSTNRKKRGRRFCLAEPGHGPSGILTGEESRSEDPELFQGNMAAGWSDNDMIEHVNPHQAACLDQTVGEIDVVLGGGRISGGVVVRQNDAGGSLQGSLP